MDNTFSMKNIFRWIRRLILVVLGLYIGLSFLGAAIYFLVTPQQSRVELLKLLFDLSLWGAIPLFIIVLLLRAWRLAIGAAVLVVFFLMLYVPYLIPRNPSISTNGTELRVMTFNTYATSEGLADAILSTDADIVALQELSQEGSEIVSQLTDTYPYQALHPQDDPNEGQGILSRYAIEADDYWQYPDLPQTLGNQRVEIEVDGARFAIFNMHPWPPLGWETGFNDESHRVVLHDIADRVDAEELPMLVVGDFNMTSVFAEYELLDRRLTDSFRAAGDGIGYTFPNDKYKPLSRVLRLDYIWHSARFEAVNSTVWDQHGESDHSPVVSTLLFHPDPQE